MGARSSCLSRQWSNQLERAPINDRNDNKPAGRSRRPIKPWEEDMLRQFIGRITTSIVLAGVAIGAGTAMAAAQSFTEWGWPQPYEKVSDKSVAWLKEKGWWPITVAFQPPWSGQSTVNIVMDRMGLMAKRGLEAKWQGFPSGPAINEVMVSARAQVGNGGNFPFTSLLDKKVPVKAIAILSPNL